MICLDFGKCLKLEHTPSCWWSKVKTSRSARTAIYSYPVLCLIEYLFSAFFNAWVQYQQGEGGGGLNRGGICWKLGGGGSMDIKIPRKRGGFFYDNIECREMPFRSNFLPLWMLFSAFLNACLLSLEVIMIRNEFCSLLFYRHCFRRLRSLLLLACPISVSVGST